MITVKQLLDAKGRTIWSAAPTASVFEALQQMAEHNVGALIVMNGKALAGIFSERDYARKVALVGKSSRELKVSDIMSPQVITVTPAQSIEECMQLMTDRRIRHLPVLEEGSVVGLVSIGDIVRSIIEDQRSTIHHLEDYITGRR